jgi:hypothetical protein
MSILSCGQDSFSVNYCCPPSASATCSRYTSSPFGYYCQTTPTYPSNSGISAGAIVGIVFAFIFVTATCVMCARRRRDLMFQQQPQVAYVSAAQV